MQSFEDHLPKISLQKLIFLFAKRQVKATYDFVPYLYGCYSFSANADLTAMVKHGILREDKTNFYKIDTNNYIKQLNEVDKKILLEIKSIYGLLSSDSLMKMTYINYQYYAINSVKAKEILNKEQYEKVELARPKSNKTTLFTIGYEGISLEQYLNKLIKNDVKILIDVRCNALSMKFGFSKTQLKNFCSSLGINYLHIPEVGIRSDQRQELKSQNDYDKLFENYIKSNLKQTITQQKEILTLLKENKRVALTCFEANICQCHRKHLAEAIIKLPEWKYELKHV